MEIHVEGWRFLPHSYAVVNEAQCLEMLKRPGITLFHDDLDLPGVTWKQGRGLRPPADEAALEAIPPSPGGRTRDEGDGAVRYRIGFPHDLGPSSLPLYVFCTCEFEIPPGNFKDERTLAEGHAASEAVLITPSTWSAEGLVRCGADPQRVRVVPHGFDPGLFHPGNEADRAAKRAQLGLANRFVYLTIGAMSENKALPEMLQAFRAVAERRPEAVLVLKGTDSIFNSKEMLEEALAETASEDLASRLVYLGGDLSADLVADLYRMADAYLAPYKAEGFCLPALEAAACGTPVIATEGGATDDFLEDAFARRISSTRQVIPNPGTGLDQHALQPSAEHLAVLMEEVMDDEAFRLRAAVEGPKRLGAKFTWARAVDRLLDVLNEN